MLPPKVKGLETVNLLYDKRMLRHRPVGWVEPDVFPEYLDDIEDDYPMENPERLRVIYDRLLNLESRLVEHGSGPVFNRLECPMATREQILLAHNKDFLERMEDLQFYTDSELKDISYDQRHDIYYNRESFQCARLAAGGLLACVDAACASGGGIEDEPHNKSLALIRPPGHHACQTQEMGFCFINSVVVAAKYAIATKKASRVVILDWDIHDGNGTAESTIKDDNIFRIDLHRFNRREGFYPYTGPPNEIGYGNAQGLNCNVTWSQGGMRNTEYAAAFYELVLPLLVDYKPDLLIISCGLDAAMGDLLGGCELTPGFFHAMTRASIEAVGPQCPVVCALEGGYTMSVIPNCMEAVTLAMLNCPYSYHSSSSSESAFCGGAAVEKTVPWPLDRLKRSRKVLSKYYIRKCSTMLLYSAVEDLNTCIKIFRSIDRWSHLHLKPIVGPQNKQQPRHHQKKKLKRKASATEENGSLSDTSMYHNPFQRPRVYMWYGTEEWHHFNRLNYSL